MTDLSPTDWLIAAARRTMFRVWVYGEEVRVAALAATTDENGQPKRAFVATLEYQPNSTTITPTYAYYPYEPEDWGLLAVWRRWGSFTRWIDDVPIAVSSITGCGTRRDIQSDDSLVTEAIKALIDHVQADPAASEAKTRFALPVIV